MSGMDDNSGYSELLANFTRLEQSVQATTLKVAYMQRAMNTFTFEQSLCLLLIMISGYTVLKVGGVRAGNSKAAILQAFMTMIGSMFGWQLLGWSLVFQENEFTSESNKGSNPFLADPIRNAINVEDDALSVWTIHSCLAGIASSIACSSFAERTTLSAYVLYPFLISSFLYPTVTHWVWSSDGWLSRNAALGLYFHDYTGGATCFMLAGAAGLAGTIIVGPRKGRFVSNRRATAIREHNLVLVGLGVSLIWTGWYGLRNGVYATVRNGLDNLPMPMICMTLSACTGSILSMLIGYKRKGFVGFVPLSNGVIAGLVAVSAGADVLATWTALVIGAVAACVYHAMAALLQRRQVDDPFGFIAVHLGCGAWGTLAVGLFADGHVRLQPHLHMQGANPTTEVAVRSLFLHGTGRQLLHQLIGTAAIIGWAVTVCGLVLLVLRLWSLRVEAEAEYRGLDLALHGGTLYPDFMVKAFKKDDVPNNWGAVVCVRVHGLDQLLRTAPPAVIKSAFRTYHNCLREQAFVMSGKEVLLLPTDDSSSEGGGTRASGDLSPFTASPSYRGVLQPTPPPRMYRSSSEMPFISREASKNGSDAPSANPLGRRATHRANQEGKVLPAPLPVAAPAADASSAPPPPPPPPAISVAPSIKRISVSGLGAGGGLGGLSARTLKRSYDGAERNLGHIDVGLLLANAATAGLGPDALAQLTRQSDAGASSAIPPALAPVPIAAAVVPAPPNLGPVPLGGDAPAGGSIQSGTIEPPESSSDTTSDSRSNSDTKSRRLRFSFSSTTGIKAWRRYSSEDGGTLDEIAALHFMFQSPDEAVRWCMAVQGALLECYWSPELLALPPTAPVYASVNGREDRTSPPMFRGMRACMGMHCGDITLTHVKMGLPALGGATGLIATAVAMAVPMPGGVYATETVIRHLVDPTHMKQQRMPDGRRSSHHAQELTFFHHGDHQLLGLQKKVSIIQLVDALTRRCGVGIPHSSTVLSPSVVDAPGFWDAWGNPDARPHVSLVFTFIAGLPRLRAWDEDATARAIKAHNALLRDELRQWGGYECQEESGAFMLAFHTVDAALMWAAAVQMRLLHTNCWEPALVARKEASAELWRGAATPTSRHSPGRPWNMLSSFTSKTSGFRRNHVTKLLSGRLSPPAAKKEDPSWVEGGSVSESSSPKEGQFSPEYLFRGLRVKMGVHWGPATAVRPHTTTGRADYFGSVVNQTARIAYSAQGGQVLVSGPAVEASSVERRTPKPSDPETATSAESEKRSFRFSQSFSLARSRSPRQPNPLVRQPSMPESARIDNSSHSAVNMPGYSGVGGDEGGQGVARSGFRLPRLRSLNITPSTGGVGMGADDRTAVPGAADASPDTEGAPKSTVPGKAVFLKEQNFKGVGHTIAVYELVVRGLEARQSYFALSTSLGGAALGATAPVDKEPTYIPLGLDSDVVASPTAAKMDAALRSSSAAPTVGRRSPATDTPGRVSPRNKRRRGSAIDWFFGSLSDMMGSRDGARIERRQTTF